MRAWRQPLRTGRQHRQRWAGADLQGNALCVIVLATPQAGERVQILDYASLTLEDALSAGTLASLAQGLKSRPERWALLLPREDVRVSVVPAPEVPADEIAQSLRWQLAPLLDFPAEDAAIDFMQITVPPGVSALPRELYAIAARGDAVQAQACLFREARLPLTAIDIHETAQRNIATRMAQPDELLAMIAFTGQEVRITISWQGELYLDRLIAEHAGDADSPSRRALLCERIALQVQRSLDAVRSSYGFLQPARIIAAGAPEGFCDSMAASVSDRVEALQPEDWFDLSAVPALREPANFMRSFHALGAALREQETSA